MLPAKTKGNRYYNFLLKYSYIFSKIQRGFDPDIFGVTEETDMAKILIADDAAFVRLTLRQILEGAGHMVVAEAADGDEAYTLYRDTRPDIVLMDITMPECSGIEGLKKIRQLDPEAKCIICSAMGQQTLVV